MEPTSQAAPALSPLVRRRMLAIRISAAFSVAVLVCYFLWLLLVPSQAPLVFLFAFLPTAFFSYRLVSKPAEQKTKNWLALAFGVGLLTLLFCLLWGATYAWDYVPLAGPLLPLLILAQFILIAEASLMNKDLGRQPGDTLKLVGGLLSAILYCTPFFVYTGEIVGAGGHGLRPQNERSATSALHSLHTAQHTYAETYRRGFTDGLNRLGPAPAPSAKRADLVDPVIAGLADGGTNTGFTKRGYVFTYTPGPPNAEGRITTFTLTARPLQYPRAGKRSFFMDESGVIRHTYEDRAATVHDPPL